MSAFIEHKFDKDELSFIIQAPAEESDMFPAPSWTSQVRVYFRKELVGKFDVTKKDLVIFDSADPFFSLNFALRDVADVLRNRKEPIFERVGVIEFIKALRAASAEIDWHVLVGLPKKYSYTVFTDGHAQLVENFLHSLRIEFEKKEI